MEHKSDYFGVYLAILYVVLFFLLSSTETRVMTGLVMLGGYFVTLFGEYFPEKESNTSIDWKWLIITLLMVFIIIEKLNGATWTYLSLPILLIIVSLAFFPSSKSI